MKILPRISASLKRNWLTIICSILLLGVTSFLAYKNYTPGTYLSGWDNLHPEFNFKLNISRSISAVWQEYQGLGVLGGMGHAADLPRQNVLLAISYLLPVSFIRYFWTFLMLFIGPLGVYFFMKYYSKGSNLASLSASVFYLFNLATVQYFFVPFETFVSFYGFLPWLIYLGYRYLKTGEGLLIYALVSLFAACAFYVQTLFIVYLIILACLSIRSFRRSIKLFITTFLVNAFWLLPVIYFSFIGGNIPANSKINKIATPETVYMNLARNDFKSIATFKGYWFDYYDYNEKTQKFDYLYKDWEAFSNREAVQYIGIGLFIVSIIGILLSRDLAWFLVFAISYTMLSGVKIPVPILSEAFRNSFTKWSVTLSFAVSVGIGLFLSKFKKFFLFLLSALVICFSIYQVIPVFNGNLISKAMRVEIPKEYFESFEYLNSRTNGGRVAVLPIYNFWGWQFHPWGYRGSGFYWYGVRNPILDRAFDVWSPKNEAFYEELNYALLKNDNKRVKEVFEKYKVSYIYHDKNLINPSNDLEDSFDYSQFKQVALFGNIEIYETGYFGEPVSAPHNLYPDHVSKVYTKLDFYTLPEPSIKEGFSTDQGYGEVRNCDLFQKGEVARERTPGGNRYIAKDGATACDYFYYSSIDNTRPFVLRIKGKNIEGRSLRIYLANAKSGRIILDELLNQGDFDEYFLVNPTYFNKEDESLPDGYTLSVETRSFGRIASENIIDTIEIYPVNLSEEDSSPKVLDNNLEVLNTKKYQTWGYVVDAIGDGLLALNQAYEKGWIALTKNGNKFSVLNHKAINGWENGWEVPKQNEDDFEVYIIFWPQILEWVGALLGIATFGAIFLKKNSAHGNQLT